MTELHVLLFISFDLVSCVVNQNSLMCEYGFCVKPYLIY